LLSVPEPSSSAAAAVPLLPPAALPPGASVDPSAPPASASAAPAAVVDAPPAPGPSEADLAAAKRMGALVALLALKGMDAALELAGGELPVELGPEDLAQAKGELAAHVAGCTERVALKYGLTLSVPYADEATVIVAVGGSVAAILAARRRREQPAKVMPSPDARTRAARDVTPAPAAPPNGAADGTGWGTWMER